MIESQKINYYFLTHFLSFKSRQQCFSDASTRRPSDLLSSFTTIKTVMNTLYDGLSEVLRNLLRSTDTRENVLEYLAEVINLNASRAHIQVNLFLICIFSKKQKHEEIREIVLITYIFIIFPITNYTQAEVSRFLFELLPTLFLSYEATYYIFVTG